MTPPPLPIGDCGLAIDGLAIADCRSTEYRFTIGIANRHPNRQSPIRRSPIRNRQSVDRQSATSNRQ